MRYIFICVPNEWFLHGCKTKIATQSIHRLTGLQLTQVQSGPSSKQLNFLFFFKVNSLKGCTEFFMQNVYEDATKRKKRVWTFDISRERMTALSKGRAEALIEVCKI